MEAKKNICVLTKNRDPSDVKIHLLPQLKGLPDDYLKEEDLMLVTGERKAEVCPSDWPSNILQYYDILQSSLACVRIMGCSKGHT